MRERNHEIMLKQELRKLREEDMKKLHQRQKRLDLKRKIDIIDKEKKNEEIKQTIQQREKALCEQRYKNLVHTNMHKTYLSDELSKWAHSGFNTTRHSAKKHSLPASGNVSPRLESLKKVILENTKPKTKKEEGALVS